MGQCVCIPEEYLCPHCLQVRLLLLDKKQAEQLKSVTTKLSKQLRKHFKWTQADLAVKLKINKAKISNFERGASPCPLELYNWIQENMSKIKNEEKSKSKTKTSNVKTSRRPRTKKTTGKSKSKFSIPKFSL